MIVALLIGMLLLCLCLFYSPKWLFLGLAVIAYGFYFEMPGQNLLIFIIFLLGILMLIVEFYVPDFGIIGLFGFIAIGISLYMHLNDLGDVVLTLLAMILVSAIGILVPLRLGKELAIGNGFVLGTSSEKEKGYSSSKDFSHLKGKRGVTVTALRPVGRCEIDNEYYEVVSSEDMIQSGTNIYVSKVEGAKIYVRKEM
ncbi:hypothetical protein HYQ40_01725 [Aerococcaceae bacterium DSM 111021]|nr:hypothetical protein [Aerococcaceae bacterium DSM 111021]